VISKLKDKIFLLAITFALSACASNGRWTKAGIPTLEQDQDQYACLKEAQQPFGYADGGPGWWGAPYNTYSGVQTNEKLYSACMKARGYQWISSP